jgi:hypothetical protein
MRFVAGRFEAIMIIIIILQAAPLLKLKKLIYEAVKSVLPFSLSS